MSLPCVAADGAFQLWCLPASRGTNLMKSLLSLQINYHIFVSNPTGHKENQC